MWPKLAECRGRARPKSWVTDNGAWEAAYAGWVMHGHPVGGAGLSLGKGQFVPGRGSGRGYWTGGALALRPAADRGLANSIDISTLSGLSVVRSPDLDTIASNGRVLRTWPRLVPHGSPGGSLRAGGNFAALRAAQPRETEGVP